MAFRQYTGPITETRNCKISARNRKYGSHRTAEKEVDYIVRTPSISYTVAADRESANVIIAYGGETVKKYRTDNGEWLDFIGTSITVYSNCTVQAKAINPFGVESHIATRAITELFHPAPEITSALSTDKSRLTVTIIYAASSTNRVCKIDDGNWTNYTGPLTLYDNCTVYAKGSNSNGLESAIVQRILTGIVIDVPVIIPGTKTSKTIVVTITYGNLVTRQYSFDNTNWVTYTGPVTISGTRTIYARGLTAIGRASSIVSYPFVVVTRRWIWVAQPNITLATFTPLGIVRDKDGELHLFEGNKHFIYNLSTRQFSIAEPDLTGSVPRTHGSRMCLDKNGDIMGIGADASNTSLTPGTQVIRYNRTTKQFDLLSNNAPSVNHGCFIDKHGRLLTTADAGIGGGNISEFNYSNNTFTTLNTTSAGPRPPALIVKQSVELFSDGQLHTFQGLSSVNPLVQTNCSEFNYNTDSWDNISFFRFIPSDLYPSDETINVGTYVIKFIDKYGDLHFLADMYEGTYQTLRIQHGHLTYDHTTKTFYGEENIGGVNLYTDNGSGMNTSYLHKACFLDKQNTVHLFYGVKHYTLEEIN
jgi:hypothetical protein